MHKAPTQARRPRPWAFSDTRTPRHSRHGPLDPTVLLCECKLVEGQHTEVFRKQARTDFDDVSFSLIYPVSKRKNRTLDVVCKDKQEYRLWVGGLRYLISHTPPEDVLRERAAAAASTRGAGAPAGEVVGPAGCRDALSKAVHRSVREPEFDAHGAHARPDHLAHPTVL